MQKIKGFTLLELMVTLSIVSILMFFSSSFAGIVRNNQIAAITQSLMADLNYARNLAIAQNTRITLCKSDSDLMPRQCTNDSGDTDWSQGWIVFIDVNNDQQITQSDVNLLRTREKLARGFLLKANTPVKNYISYQSNGFSRKQNGSLQMGSLALCDPQESHSPLRIITISSAGRTKISLEQPNSEYQIDCHI